MKVLRTRPKDERIENLKNKQYKETYRIVLSLCAISVIVKQFYFGWGINSVISELVIVFVSSLYLTIQSVRHGLYSDEVEMNDNTSKYSISTKNIIWGAIFGVVLASLFGLNSALNYAESTTESVWFFFMVFVFSLIIYIPAFIVVMLGTHHTANHFSKKRSRAGQDE